MRFIHPVVVACVVGFVNVVLCVGIAPRAVAQPAFCTIAPLGETDTVSRAFMNDHGDIAWEGLRGGISIYDADTGTVVTPFGGPKFDSLQHSRDNKAINNSGDTVWLGFDFSHFVDIFLYRAADGSITQLTDSDATEDWISIADTGDVVWQVDPGPGVREIWLYKAATGGAIKLNNDGEWAERPAINAGGDVVWKNWDTAGGDWDIFLYTAADGSIVNLSNNTRNDSDAAIGDGGDVVWTSRSGSVSDLYLYEADSGTVTPLTDDSVFEQRPVINVRGDVAWYRSDGNDFEVYLYRASDDSITELSDQDGHDQIPLINNRGDVLWRWEDPADFRNKDLFLYDGATGSTLRLTDDPNSDHYVDFNNNGELLWFDQDSTALNVLMYSTFRPRADAGPDQSFHLATPVVLDGTGSCDPNGDALTAYSWTMTSKPAGSTAALVGADTPTPGFTIDVLGDYVARLIVDDGLHLSIPNEVTVSLTNATPVADAGPQQVIDLVGTEVTLDGSGSSDGDGDVLTFLWTLASRPQGSSATLDDPTAVMPKFIADVNGAYSFSLQVTDAPYGETSELDYAVVTFANVPPVADAGADQEAAVGDTVVLDGLGSSDANLDPLTYHWSFASVPEGSVAWLSGTDPLGTSSFFADLPGTYVVSLLVHDGVIVSPAADTVTIEVASTVEGAVASLSGAIDAIEGLDDEAFRFPQQRLLLLLSTDWILQSVEAGNYAQALAVLELFVIRRTDGCANGGEPDLFDWIRDCEAQALVHPRLEQAVCRIEQILDPSSPPPVGEESPPPPPPPPGGGGL